MARLLTFGYEVEQPGSSVIGPDNPLGLAIAGTVGQNKAGVGRSGVACAEFQSGAGNAVATQTLCTPAASDTTYIRAAMYAYFNSPTANIKVMRVGTVGVSVRLTTGLKYQLWNDSAGTQIGADSSATGDNTHYNVIELKVVLNGSSQITDVELRMDGGTVASASGLTLASTTAQIGWIDAPGASKYLRVDDVAVNNSAGANNNTWCGLGKVVLLKPVTDNAVGTGWTLGNGTAISANSGATATQKTPPLGIADLGGAGADTGQIRNATSNANTAYNPNLTTYTAAGVGASDTINALHPWTCTGAPLVTSAKAGTFGLTSNPAITLISLGAAGTSGAFWAGHLTIAYAQPPVAPATSGWKWSPGTITEAPSVTLGTAPVASINQVTSSTRIAQCCFVGMYVDYTPASGTLYQKTGFGWAT